MTTYEETSAKDRFLKSLREHRYGYIDDSKLLVSLHGVEFSMNTEDYYEVADDIFFSNLLYLLYVRKVAAGNDFETAKERAKSVIVSELEKKKYGLLSKATLRNEDTLDSIITGRKLILLDRAISVLESDENNSLFVNYNVPEGL